MSKLKDSVIKAALENRNERTLLVALDALKGEGQGLGTQTGGKRRTVEASPQTGNLNVEAARKWLGGISRTSLWRYRHMGLRSVNLGGRVFFRLQDLSDFTNRHLSEAAEVGQVGDLTICSGRGGEA